MAEIRTKRWNEPAEPADGTRIFVARFRPRYLRKGAEPWDEWRRELAPSPELLAAWYGKDGRTRMTFEEYTQRYLKEMEAQTESIAELARRFAAGETLTFLCFCRDETQCHRTLLKGLVERSAAALPQKVQ